MVISNGIDSNVTIDFSLVIGVNIDVSKFLVIFVLSSGESILVYRQNLEGVFKVIDRMVKYNGDSVPVKYI